LEDEINAGALSLVYLIDFGAIERNSIERNPAERNILSSFQTKFPARFAEQMLHPEASAFV
jgi:hypothetical protein